MSIHPSSVLNIYDIAWRMVLAAAAVLSGFSPKMRRKVGKALRERDGSTIPLAPAGGGPCVMIHAVSLGEMNATRTLVAELAAARPHLRFLITVTTDTGFARGAELYAADPRITLVRYPLDLSIFIRRLLVRQRPDIVVLMELEVWPNFVLHCRRRGIPIVLVNGRLTESSFKTYRYGGPLVQRIFARLSDVCAQDAAYATRFVAIGARPENVQVTGTMKFDTAEVGSSVAGASELGDAVGLRPGRGPIWVCGSTGPGEEAIVLDVYRGLLASHPMLRLAIIPRHPQRFEEVAALIVGRGFALLRRSNNAALQSKEISEDVLSPGSVAPEVVLGDTMGELRKFYSLADVVLVGRSLIDLGPRQRGSDMIEPAALAKPVIVGPWTQNFADVVRQLKLAKGLQDVSGADALQEAIARFLADPGAASAMGRRSQDVVRAQQGATARHVKIILSRLGL